MMSFHSIIIGDLAFSTTYVECFAAIPWHVLIHFGKGSIINCPLRKKKRTKICMQVHGVAFAVMGRLEEAEAE